MVPAGKNGWPEITGFARLVQPNAVLRGEYAACSLIREYHASRGRSATATSCLIPTSEHDKSSQRSDGRIQGCAIACLKDGDITIGPSPTAKQTPTRAIGRTKW